MIVYSETKRIFPNFNKPTQEKKRPASFWTNLFKNVARVFFDIVIEIAADAVLFFMPIGGFAAQLAKIGARFVKDVILDLIFDNEINAKSILMNLAFAIGSSVGRLGVNTLAKIKKYKWVSKTYKTSKELIEFFKKPLLDKIVDVAKKSSEFFAKTSKTSNAIITKLFNSATISKIDKVVKKAAQIYKNPLSVIATGQEFAVQKIKNKVQEVAQKTRTKFFVKMLQNKKLNGVNYQRINKWITKSNKGIILPPNGSSWIWGIKLYDSDWWDNSKWVDFRIYFKDEATSTSKSKLRRNGTKVGKAPVEIMRCSFDKFQRFLNSKSWGKFYLDEFAWGWGVGKLIREKKELSFKDLYELEAAKIDLKKLGISYGDSSDSENFELFDKYVKQHRTSRNKIANLTKNNGTYNLSFKNKFNQVKAGKYNRFAVRRIKRR